MDIIDLINGIRETLEIDIKKSLDDFIDFEKNLIDNDSDVSLVTVYEVPEGICWSMVSDIVSNLEDGVELYCENYTDILRDANATREYTFTYRDISFNLNYNLYVGDFQINYISTLFSCLEREEN